MATGFEVLHIEKRIAIPSGLNRHITRVQFITEGEDRIVAVWVPDNADPNKTADNVELVSRESIDEEGKKITMTLQQAVDKRIREAGIKPRKGQASCLEIIFSGSHDIMTAMSKEDLSKWANETLEWAQKQWGKENVVCAILHVDETTPHIHMIVVPIVTGQSRRTKYMQSIDKTAKKYNIDHTKLRLCMNEVYTRGKLYAYHDNYAMEVGSKYGLERGIMAEPGSKKNHTESIEHNRMLAAQAAELQKLIEELTSDYDSKKTEIQEDIQQLQGQANTLSSAVENEERKKKEAEEKAKKAEEQSRKAEERLSVLEGKINHNKKVINNQVTDFNARKEELEQTKADITTNEATILEQKEEIGSNNEYLHELKTIKDEIAKRKAELNALSSLGLQKMILEIPKMTLADIQKRIQRYWKGNVTSYEIVQYAVGDGPEEEFAKINIKNGGQEYFIEIREKTGNVYYNGGEEPYKRKNGEEIIMPELAEYFRAELTPAAKNLIASLYKKPAQTENIVWQSKQILGNARIIQNEEGCYTLQAWDRDFRKWVEVSNCVNFEITGNNTLDCIILHLKNGNIKYVNQFGHDLSRKQLQKLGIVEKGYGGQKQ